jgi:hypothetical protein
MAQHDDKNDRSGSPILRSRQVGPWRILGTRPKPQPDSALVYATVDGVFRTLERPMTAGEWAFRGLRRIFEVDMATRRQVVRFPLPSKWDVPPFQATLEIWWRVVDPAQVVQQRIDDVGNLFLSGHLVELRGIAREFPYAASSDAELALNAQLPDEESWVVAGAAKILRAFVQVDQDDLVHGHRLDQLAEHHQAHITGIRREALTRFMTDGQLGMLAYHLTQNPDDALAVAEALAEQDRISLETSLQITLQAINSGKVQDVEADGLRHDALHTLLTKVRDGHPKAFEKLKNKQPIELAAEQTVVDAEVVAEEQDD